MMNQPAVPMGHSKSRQEPPDAGVNQSPCRLYSRQDIGSCQEPQDIIRGHGDAARTPSWSSHLVYCCQRPSGAAWCSEGPWECRQDAVMKQSPCILPSWTQCLKMLYFSKTCSLTASPQLLTALVLPLPIAMGNLGSSFPGNFTSSWEIFSSK